MYRYIHTQQYSIITLFETDHMFYSYTPISSVLSSEMALNIIFVFLKKLKKSFGGCP